MSNEQLLAKTGFERMELDDKDKKMELDWTHLLVNLIGNPPDFRKKGYSKNTR